MHGAKVKIEKRNFEFQEIQEMLELMKNCQLPKGSGL
jgi:hypothetical protein